MIREPLLLIAAFFIFFFLAIIYVRLDFSISKDEGYEARLKVSGLCEKVTTIQVISKVHNVQSTYCYEEDCVTGSPMGQLRAI
jgi:hypothetical protein